MKEHEEQMSGWGFLGFLATFAIAGFLFVSGGIAAGMTWSSEEPSCFKLTELRHDIVKSQLVDCEN